MAEMAGAFEIFGKKESGGVEKWTINEAGEYLLRQTPGIVIFDNDFTLKPAAYELGMGGKEPGRLPEESMQLLRDLRVKGWHVRVVTNQPKEGHQVARWVRKAKKASYPIFPSSVKEELGDEGVDGAGKDFLWNKYKKSSEAIARTVAWIEEYIDVPGAIYFVGDRESDVDFANRVREELVKKGIVKEVRVLTVEGLVLPKKLKALEKVIP
mgnify:CR=1 FL=1